MERKPSEGYFVRIKVGDHVGKRGRWIRTDVVSGESWKRAAVVHTTAGKEVEVFMHDDHDPAAYLEWRRAPLFQRHEHRR